MDGVPVSQKQIDFFNNLLSEKAFPPEAGTVDELREQFRNLNKKSASEWIDKAMKLSDKDSADEPLQTAPF